MRDSAVLPALKVFCLHQRSFAPPMHGAYVLCILVYERIFAKNGGLALLDPHLASLGLSLHKVPPVLVALGDDLDRFSLSQKDGRKVWAEQ